jgi:hypothetical protein
MATLQWRNKCNEDSLASQHQSQIAPPGWWSNPLERRLSFEGIYAREVIATKKKSP